MSCDVCDFNILRMRPGGCYTCPTCGHERMAPDVDIDEFRELLSHHDELLMQHEFDDDDEAPGLTRMRLEEADDRLRGFLWRHRWALMHGACEHERRISLTPLRYDYTMRDAEWR